MNERWACSICGYHPDSDSMWCGAGCGRDYNRMIRLVERRRVGAWEPDEETR